MINIKRKPLNSFSDLITSQKSYDLTKTCVSTNNNITQYDFQSINMTSSPIKNLQNSFTFTYAKKPEISREKKLKRSLAHSLKRDIKSVLSQCKQPFQDDLQKKIQEQKKINMQLKAQIKDIKTTHKIKIHRIKKHITQIQSQYDSYDKQLKILSKEVIQMGL